MSSIKRLVYLAAIAGLSSCSLQKKIGASAKEDVIDAPGLQTAHIGISVFEPATGKYWYDYQAEKYFVPASNTKIFTCYAGMKYLGDSLPGIKYLETNDELLLFPTGDPKASCTRISNATRYWTHFEEQQQDAFHHGFQLAGKRAGVWMGMG